jgi:hypothetical protein
MANMTPEQFMEKYGKGDPKEFQEFIEKYMEYIRETTEAYMNGGYETTTDEEYYDSMSYDAFIKNLSEKG